MKLLNKNMRILFLISIITIVVSAHIQVSFAGKEKVKVGFTQEETELNKTGFSPINQYTLKYLNEISKYTGYDYNYQLLSIDDNLKKLESGEIDILCCCDYNVMDNTKFSTSSYFFGWHNINIVIKDDGKPLTYNDYINLDGACVGTLEEGIHHRYADKFFKDLGAAVTYKKFKTKNDIILALKQGSIDCAIISFNKMDEGTKTIASIKTHKNSLVVNSKNKDLLDNINFAMEQIQSKNSGFASQLLKECYPDYKTSFSGFTKQELDFISTNPKIKVAINYSNRGVYNIDDEGKRAVISKILSDISNTSGIQIEFVDAKFISNIQSDINEQRYSAISSYSEMIDIYGQFSRLFDITQPYIKAPLVVVGTERLSLKSADEPIVFAVYYDIPQVREAIFRSYPNAIIRRTKDIKETLNSIKDKTADAIVIESYVKDYINYSLEYPHLKYYSKTDINIPISIAVAKTENPLIYSILNKSISIIDEKQIEDIIYSYLTTKKQQVSFVPMIKYYFPDMFPIIFAIILIVLSIFLGYVYSVNSKLKSIVFSDKITEHINYYKFMEVLKQHVKNKTACNYCIIYFDIRKFKYINTTFGFETGNIILKTIALSLNTQLNEDECFARVYADNFVILLNKNEGYIDNRIRSIVRTTRKYILNKFNYINVTGRFGVYDIQCDDQIVTDIIDNANIARQFIGNNMNEYISYYNDEVRNNIFKEKEIEDNMQSALNHGEFKVFIQPKNNMNTGDVCGGEALIRWLQPKGKMIYPNDFIPVFEKNGFIVKIDMFVLESVCKFIRHWMDEGYKIVPISINLSRIHISNPNIVKGICKIVDSFNIPRSYVELELTESTDYDDMKQLIEVLKELHNEGFLIAMDDFGKAYSSLTLLKEIPIDILKLDKDFLTSCAENTKGETIIEIILSMSKKLGLEVVCEGVETKEQVNFLTSIGYEIAQGYYFSKPMAVTDFEKLAFGNSKMEVISFEY